MTAPAQAISCGCQATGKPAKKKSAAELLASGQRMTAVLREFSPSGKTVGELDPSQPRSERSGVRDQGRAADRRLQPDRDRVHESRAGSEDRKPPSRRSRDGRGQPRKPDARGYDRLDELAGRRLERSSEVHGPACPAMARGEVYVRPASSRPTRCAPPRERQSPSRQGPQGSQLARTCRPWKASSAALICKHQGCRPHRLSSLQSEPRFRPCAAADELRRSAGHLDALLH